jgi:hypothetical protein
VRGTDGAETGIADAALETVIWSQARETQVYGPQFHRNTDRVVGSPDLVRGWGRTDGRMVVERPRNVWYDLVPVIPADDYQEGVQRTFFTVWPDMLVVEMLERQLAVLKDLDLGPGPKWWRVGQLRATKRAPKFAIRSQGRLAYDGKINDYGLRPSSQIEGILEPGDYLAYYNGAVTNNAYVLGEGRLRYAADLKNGWVSLYAPCDENKPVIPAGTTVKYTLFSVVSPNLSGNWPADSLQFVELFRDRMGLDGDVPYRILPSRGRVISTNYVAVAEAEEGEFVASTEGLDLPASLPLEVRGLNRNWSAGFADLEKSRYRPIAMHQGTSYVSLSPRQPRQHFFVGHPAVADDPQVVLCCTQLDAANWALEIHNPTDTPRKATVRPAPGLSFLDFDRRTVEVPPGASVHLAIASRRSAAP